MCRWCQRAHRHRCRSCKLPPGLTATYTWLWNWKLRWIPENATAWWCSWPGRSTACLRLRPKCGCQRCRFDGNSVGGPVIVATGERPLHADVGDAPAVVPAAPLVYDPADVFHRSVSPTKLVKVRTVEAATEKTKFA